MPRLSEGIIRQIRRASPPVPDGAVLSRSAQAVKAVHLRDAGVVRGPGQFTWTDAERAVLREAYENAGKGNVGLKALAAKLGRLQSNVSREARRMGLTRKGRPQPDATVEVLRAKANQRQAEGRGPKPVYGIVPSTETRAKMSAAAKKALAEGRHPSQTRVITDEVRQKMSAAMTARLQAGGNVYSRCKHGRREDLGGQFFRSSWEANYARFLEWQKGRGLIADWKYEPETFWFEKIKRGVRSYLPDFRVTELNGSTYYVEVKGWMDAKSKTKLKRMAKYHPTVDLRVIGSKPYKEIAKKLGGAIPGWE